MNCEILKNQARDLTVDVLIIGGNAVRWAAHQLELLTELLGELPEGNSIVQPDLSEIPDNAHWAYFKGQKYAIDQVVSAIERKMGELNG